MIIERPDVFLSPGFLIRSATARWEHDGAALLRHRTFVEEQGLFAIHDRDAIDAVALPLVAISTYAAEADEVVGAVRIHEAQPGLWRGSRLAVAPRYRRVGRLGTELIRLAVGTAHARGCTRFLAHVQMQNVALFERLDWRALGEARIQGAAHMEMEADLTAYPKVADPAVGWAAWTRRRAA